MNNNKTVTNLTINITAQNPPDSLDEHLKIAKLLHSCWQVLTDELVRQGYYGHLDISFDWKNDEQANTPANS
jgi:hypothetical protein